MKLKTTNASGPSKVELLKKFGLKKNATLRQLKETYRKKVQQLHPDKLDGSLDGFLDLQRLYNDCVKAFEDETCDLCEGTGQVKHEGITMLCPICSIS